jgi:hypothetical protein
LMLQGLLFWIVFSLMRWLPIKKTYSFLNVDHLIIVMLVSINHGSCMCMACVSWFSACVCMRSIFSCSG